MKSNVSGGVAVVIIVIVVVVAVVGGWKYLSQSGGSAAGTGLNSRTGVTKGDDLIKRMQESQARAGQPGAQPSAPSGMPGMVSHSAPTGGTGAPAGR